MEGNKPRPDCAVKTGDKRGNPFAQNFHRCSECGTGAFYPQPWPDVMECPHCGMQDKYTPALVIPKAQSLGAMDCGIQSAAFGVPERVVTNEAPVKQGYLF